jgi:hypothetical protein
MQDDREVTGASLCRGEIFSVCPERPDRFWSTPSLLYNGRQASFLWRGRLSRQEREADHSLSFSAEAKNSGAIFPSLPSTPRRVS